MKHLIIGFCAAGANAAETIRREDDAAEIVVLNGEGGPFYLRLDLEGVFKGHAPERLMPRAPEYWRARRITVLADRAVAVDPDRQLVRCASGGALQYDRLLIATGASPRALNVTGRDLKGIFHYHTLHDAQAILAQRDHVRNAVIVGGGILALELAAFAREFGWNTTLLVRGKQVGTPFVDAAGGAFVHAALARAGVSVIYEDEVVHFAGNGGRLESIMTQHGQSLPAQFTALCIGVQPAVAFLESSGLLSSGELVVDDRLRTRAPRIFAAGDAAIVQLPDGARFPCNMWSVAAAQARIAARNMCGADEAWSPEIPYNLDHLFDQEFALIGAWERRHEAGFQIHELATASAYRALVTRDGVLAGAFLLGDRTHDRRLRKLIAARARVAGKLDRLFADDARPDEFKP